jgi:hypothetical protein
MKKWILLSLILFSSILQVNAQWTGSTSIENNLWRNGNLGIGIAAPAAKLHIDKINGTGIILSTNNAGTYLNPLSRKIQWGNYLGNDAGSIDLLDMSQDTNGSSMVFTIKSPLNALQEALRINWLGDIGIGTASPAAKLHIDKINGTGIILSTKNAGTISNPLSRKIQWGNYLGNDVGSIDLLDMSQDTNGSSMVFTIKNPSNALQEALRINWLGDIGIGTTKPSYKLDVCGTIRAKEIKVELSGGCDFVFKKDYKLMNLNELEEFVTTKQHLPEIASEKEMIEDGLNMKEFQMKLLQKIEELTLYTIAQNKELKKQSTIIEKQNQKFKILNAKIKKLEYAKR